MTNEELVRKELGRRFKNMVYRRAEDVIQQCIDQCGGLERMMSVDDGTRYVFSYNLEILVEDLIEINAGIEREKNENLSG